MLLLLARHGNTFAPGEQPCWLGSRTDRKLVPSGIEQAKALAQALKERKFIPDTVYSGPLCRAQDYARLILEHLASGCEVTLDSRLNEIDYGLWEGLSNQQITERFGGEALDNWQLNGIAPEGAQWQPGVEILKAEARGLLEEIRSLSSARIVLVVSSNGRLRYLHQALGADLAQGKMKTGQLGAARLEGASSRLLFWDISPKEIESLPAL